MLYSTIIESIGLYGAEMWEITETIQALQMDFLWRSCGISRLHHVRNDRIKEIVDLDKTITDGGREAVGLVWSPTKDVRREVAKEDLGMDPTWKEKRTTMKDLV
jgi:hypothetical protein